MKKTIIKNILGIATVVSLFIACSEAETFINQILWSGSWLGITFLCGKAYAGMMSKAEKEEKV